MATANENKSPSIKLCLVKKLIAQIAMTNITMARIMSHTNLLIPLSKARRKINRGKAPGDLTKLGRQKPVLMTTPRAVPLTTLDPMKARAVGSRGLFQPAWTPPVRGRLIDK